ncbi:MAG: hypothetical protein IPL65_21220 [Lewinellaceae bacterium]|nr:hypothetical protein [Lewinellaceae bacterium]
MLIVMQNQTEFRMGVRADECRWRGVVSQACDVFDTTGAASSPVSAHGLRFHNVTVLIRP